MAFPARPRSPLSLVVLALVCEEPMHPYRMQALIKERGKDLVANVDQRNSVYQTIDALRRAGLIAVRETSREERRPERTVYQPTKEGRHTLLAWLRTILASPAREFPDFPAALSLVPLLRPEELRRLLETRIGTLAERLAKLEQPVPGVPRLFLLEIEYMAALVRAEIAWLREVTADLRSRRLTWSEAWLRRIVAQLASPATLAAPDGRTAPAPTRSAPTARRRRETATATPTGSRRWR